MLRTLDKDEYIMAINPLTDPEYQGAVTPASSAMPYGAARNDVVPGDFTGTPRVANEVNDQLGLFQSILRRNSNEAPNGEPDSVENPQILEALINLMSPVSVRSPENPVDISGVGDEYDYTPPDNVTGIIYEIQSNGPIGTTLARVAVDTMLSEDNTIITTETNVVAPSPSPLNGILTVTQVLGGFGAVGALNFVIADKIKFRAIEVPEGSLAIQIVGYTTSRGRLSPLATELINENES